MRLKDTALALGVVALLVTAGIGTSVAQQAEPAYPLEGAWFGMVTIGGQPTPSLDTFTSNAQRKGIEGTFLCTIPPMQVPIPGGVLTLTASGHGNWVRIAKNTYAFTAVRSIVNQAGRPFGWARFWGTISAVSEDEYSGTMNAQFYTLDGTPFSPLFTGTLASRRIPIQFEDPQ